MSIVTVRYDGCQLSTCFYTGYVIVTSLPGGIGEFINDDLRQRNSPLPLNVRRFPGLKDYVDSDRGHGAYGR
ncbi:hypothetical protein [Spirosoma fluminis]